MSQQEAQFHTIRFLLNKSVFDDNVINIILCYYWDSITDKKLVMLDWIDTTLLDTHNSNDRYDAWYNISKNPNAISYIEENMDMVCWNGLVKNPNAIHLLEENTVEIAYADCWESIFSNIHGIDFFFSNTNKLIEYNYDPSWDKDDYDELINDIIGEGIIAICKNPNVISFINKDDPDTLHIHNGLLVYWDALSSNPNAIQLLEANQHKINWSNLSKNPNAIHLLGANQDKIDWSNLSKNPNAIQLLKINKDKIDWSKLSKNPNAIDLLKANKDKIDWSNIYRNPSIFHYKLKPNY